jgi:hypothetical protein
LPTKVGDFREKSYVIFDSVMTFLTSGAKMYSRIWFVNA